MGLVLKHVEESKTGNFHYRRRVPKEILGVVGKTMFKKKLGGSRNEALVAWPKVHAEIERAIAEAHKCHALTMGLSLADLSDRDAYALALRRRADLVAAGATEDELGHTGDMLAESYPQDDSGPRGVPPRRSPRNQPATSRARPLQAP